MSQTVDMLENILLTSQWFQICAKFCSNHKIHPHAMTVDETTKTEQFWLNRALNATKSGKR